MAEKRSIIDESHDFWTEIVRPVLTRHCPTETARMAAGFFGYGSEVLRLDDEYSTDHHFGLRVNILLPQDIMQAKGKAIEDSLSASQVEKKQAEFSSEKIPGAPGSKTPLTPKAKKDL